MKKFIIATCMVAATLVVFTRCSEDDVIADNETQMAAQAEERQNENARKKDNKYIATPVTGTINGIAFTGDYRITEFKVQNDILYAVGTLNNIAGTGLPEAVTNLSGQQIMMQVDTPPRNANASTSTSDAAAAAVGSCDVLFLQLGPLDLDLLGLQIHLDQVTLNIDAATGSGNLLGNLLCAVTGLLDGVGSLVAIAQLLNQIIGLIGTVG
ncbi:MAG TPA: hypothetical protein VGD65_01465 [Chryseosolibacter sp.]